MPYTQRRGVRLGNDNIDSAGQPSRVDALLAGRLRDARR
jgi:hypothetical protein